MVNPEIYMEANAPTVAEWAIKNALWHGTPTRETVARCVGVPCQYCPADQFWAAILEHLHGALNGPDGLQRFIRGQLWRCPARRTVSDYIRHELETELTPAQIVATVLGVDA